MGLPTSRDETAVAGALVRTVLINSIQDAIIGLHNLVRGQRIAQIHPADMLGFGDWIWNGGTWQHNTDTVNVTTVTAPIPLNIGDRVVGVKVYLNVNTAASAGAMAAHLGSLRYEAGSSEVVRSAVYSVPNAMGDFVQDLTGITPAAVVAGDRWYVTIANNHAFAVNRLVKLVEVTIDHPL